MTSQLTEIALQMLGTIERMELIIPEITDTIRKALEEKAALAEPEPPAVDGEVAELVECLSDSLEADSDIHIAYQAGANQQLEACCEWLEQNCGRWDLPAALRAALAGEPVPPNDGEVAELVCRLRDWQTDLLLHERERAADLLEHLVPVPVPEMPSDHDLTMTYAYAVAAAVDNKRGPFKKEDAEAAQLAGLRAVLARWGQP